MAEGRPVEEALMEGRLALLGSTREWVTPVLFLKAEDGRLVKPRPKAPRRRKTVARRVDRDGAEPPQRIHFGVRSVLSWGERMGEEIDSDHLLDLDSSFDGRAIIDPEWWQTRVFPDLQDFLARVGRERRPVLLDFAAHQSIAFAAGWCLDAKSGVDVSVRQRGLRGSFEWHPNDGTEPDRPLWQPPNDRIVHPAASDVALAVAITHPNVVDDVDSWSESQQPPLQRIIRAVIAPEPGDTSVLGGAHALALAQKLALRARTRTSEERSGRLHILGAAPNAFFFYLGQLSRSFGPITLYEFNFDRPELREYRPSILFPPPDR